MNKIAFKQVTFPQSNIIYTKYKGKYDMINTKVQQVLKDTTPYFKLSDLFGIYYDPEENKNPDDMEAAIGIMVRDV